MKEKLKAIFKQKSGQIGRSFETKTGTSFTRTLIVERNTKGLLLKYILMISLEETLPLIRSLNCQMSVD